MPTYHYRCKACNHEFEEFQSMADDPLTKCPSCKKSKLVRIISGSGLVFKGSGFYLTDYKKQGASSAETAGEKKPASGASTGTGEEGTTGGTEGGKEAGGGSGKPSGTDPGKASGRSPAKEGGSARGKEPGRQAGRGKPPSTPPSGDKA